jgi:hypothetical protein
MTPLERTMEPVLDMVYETGPQIPVGRMELGIQKLRERFNLVKPKVKGHHKKLKRKRKKR